MGKSMLLKKIKSIGRTKQGTYEAKDSFQTNKRSFFKTLKGSSSVSSDDDTFTTSRVEIPYPISNKKQPRKGSIIALMDKFQKKSVPDCDTGTSSSSQDNSSSPSQETISDLDSGTQEASIPELSSSSDRGQESVGMTKRDTLEDALADDDDLTNGSYETMGVPEKLSEKEKILMKKYLSGCNALKDGDIAVAHKAFTEVHQEMIKEYGRDHKRTGASLHNMGIVHMRSGNNEDALVAIENAVEIRKKTLGDIHPKVADSLQELGVVLLSKGEFEDAVEIFHEALEIRKFEAAELVSEVNIMKNQIQISKILNNIGCAYFEHGEAQDAKNAFMESLQIIREALEYDYDDLTETVSVTLASTLCNIGYMNLEQCEWSSALLHFEEALKLQEELLDTHSTIIVNTRENLAYTYVKLQDYGNALLMYNKVLKSELNARDSNDIELVAYYKKVLYCQLNLLLRDEALQTVEKIEEIQILNLPPSSRQLRRTQELLEQLEEDSSRSRGIIETITTSVRNPLTKNLLCKCAMDTDSNEFDLKPMLPRRPPVNIKTSGHKLSFI